MFVEEAEGGENIVDCDAAQGRVSQSGCYVGQHGTSSGKDMKVVTQYRHRSTHLSPRRGEYEGRARKQKPSRLVVTYTS